MESKPERLDKRGAPLSNQSPPETGAGYSIEEAAAAIRLSYVTVYRRVSSGEWPGGQVGRKWLVSRSFVDALAEAIGTKPQVNAKTFAAEWMTQGDTVAPAGAVGLAAKLDTAMALLGHTAAGSQNP